MPSARPVRPVRLAALSASLAAGLVASSAAPARAGGYLAGGLGGGATLDGALARNFDSADHDSGRLSLGHRIGPIAVEASFFGAGLTGVNDFTARQDYTTYTLGVDLKYFVGIVGPLEAYGKGGLNKTWLRAPDVRAAHDYAGRGWDLGVGLQYTFDAVLAGAGIWLDYTHQVTELRDRPAKPRLDGELGLLSVGLSVSL